MMLPIIHYFILLFEHLSISDHYGDTNYFWLLARLRSNIHFQYNIVPFSVTYLYLQPRLFYHKNCNVVQGVQNNSRRFVINEIQLYSLAT